MQSQNFDSLPEPEGSFYQYDSPPVSIPEATKSPEIQVEVQDVPVSHPVQTGNASSPKPMKTKTKRDPSKGYTKLAQARRANQQRKRACRFCDKAFCRVLKSPSPRKNMPQEYSRTETKPS
ncbi:hypothetical protein BLNAU_7986 [Blattamonas nauphoetae]|uniref:Uncharacterized protein n=1 Tax=Blattamonas nauphoetae TaxID=2049346 RepID=A0ABQ9Y0A8_9EUKA|nr:hypothetical protein BLNAU_7986 [Blattamonas nauphoetae]